MLELNRIYNMDCMEGMAQFPDKYFELAIVDPPYFSGPQKLGYYGGGISTTNVKRPNYQKIGQWRIPGKAYYRELLRVSANQIIWGINYFSFEGISSGRIVWDKQNENSSFSDGEIASCSLITVVRFFRFRWNGMLQGNMAQKEHRIHPTQKPVKLYQWLLHHYANPGDKILDTHVGSASSLIACYQMGFDYIGFEIDPDYHALAMARLERHKQQGRLEL